LIYLLIGTDSSNCARKIQRRIIQISLTPLISIQYRIILYHLVSFCIISYPALAFHAVLAVRHLQSVSTILSKSSNRPRGKCTWRRTSSNLRPKPSQVYKNRHDPRKQAEQCQAQWHSSVDCNDKNSKRVILTSTFTNHQLTQKISISNTI